MKCLRRNKKEVMLESTKRKWTGGSNFRIHEIGGEREDEDGGRGSKYDRDV